MIEASHLTKRFGPITAVKDLTFSIGRGEIVGFLGPNGAGKTTTLRMISGFLGPSSGSIRVSGIEVTEDPVSAQKRLGYMPEGVPLYPEMRVIEYLNYRAELKGVPKAERKGAVGTSLARARVEEVANFPIGRLSKGFRQRVGLADALVSNPDLLVLDEPTSGLDPNQVREVRAVLRELSEDHTVIVSTHILGEVEATCSRAIVIHKGRLVADSGIEALKRGVRGQDLVILFRAGPADMAKQIASLGGIAGVTERDLSPDGIRELTCTFEKSDPSADLLCEDLLARIYALGGKIREARRTQGALEDVFRELTQADAQETETKNAEKETGPR